MNNSNHELSNQELSNQALFEQAKQHIPGGVNSPVRAFKSVGGSPVFIQSAKGSKLFSVEGKTYIDYIGSWGPMIAGHNHPQVIQAVQEATQNGLSFGTPTTGETEIAQSIKKLMPAIEMVRLVNSGTEATMSALRLARAYTKRDKFIKFEGCYHGHADSFLIKAGSGLLTLGHPSSPGVPESTASHTINLEFNNCQQVVDTFAEIGEQIAAIIVEPIAGNMNCIPGTPEFIRTLREQCNQHQSVLIFDEVMTGFRVNLHGATHIYNVQPDLITLGKIIGGGMPVGAFGGKAEIMRQLAPLGPVYQAGTLAGNPISVAAGLATLDIIQQPDFFSQLTAITEQLVNGFQQIANDSAIPLQTNYAGGMFGLFIGAEHPVTRFNQVAKGVDAYNKIFHQMLQRGVYLAPSGYEAGFVSSAHSQQDIDQTLQAFAESLKTIS